MLNIFQVPVVPLSVFLGKMSIQILCLFFNWITCFSAIDLHVFFFINFRYGSLIRYAIYKYFLPFNKLPFHFINGFLCYAKNFLVWCIPTCLFLLLLPLLLMSNPKNIVAEANVKEFITYVFFRNFMVSSLTFKSLIHFELGFV